MAFQDLVIASQKYFPNLKIKYKDQSWLMKLLGKLIFFNSSFMIDYTTTIGNTIYFPNTNSIKLHPVSSGVTLMHELVHMHDQKRITKPLFFLSYLFPQILSPLLLLLLFIINWKIIILLSIIFLLPLPAIFRMHWEKRAYISSLYVIQKLGIKMNFNPHLDIHLQSYLNYFSSSSYYYMWPFNINKQFTQNIINIQSGLKPFQDPIFDMLDDLSDKI